MEERRRGDDLDIVLREAEQFRIADEIVAVRVMPAEGDEDADVMQDRRVTQERPRRIRFIVQSEFQRAVKKGQGQIRHMQGMLFLKTAGPGQSEHALVADGKIRLQGVRHGVFQIFHKQAVAQAPVADLTGVAVHFLHDGLENGRARNNDSRTFRVDAGQKRAFRLIA